MMNDLELARLRAHLRQQMADWPKLTDAQVRRIGYLLNPPPKAPRDLPVLARR